MNQIVKDKMDREVMVIKNSILFSEIKRESKFYSNKEYDFEKIILNNFDYMRRWDAEVNFDYKQPISYWVVLNDKNEVFVYKRWWSSSNAWESRLHSKISFWVGGHIEKSEEKEKNPVHSCLVKEIEEELNLRDEDIASIETIWYINDDWNEVWKVHIWVAYLIKVHSSKFDLLDWELEKWEFTSISDLENMIKSDEYDVESWSNILFEPIVNILK